MPVDHIVADKHRQHMGKQVRDARKAAQMKGDKDFCSNQQRDWVGGGGVEAALVWDCKNRQGIHI